MTASIMNDDKNKDNRISMIDLLASMIHSYTHFAILVFAPNKNYAMLLCRTNLAHIHIMVKLRSQYIHICLSYVRDKLIEQKCSSQ